MASSPSSGKEKEKSPGNGAVSPKSGNNSEKELNKAPNQMKIIGTKRIVREMEEIKANPPIFVEGLDTEPDNIRKWFIIIKPRINPYKHGAFKIKLNLHPEYPFKPPRIQFLTPIYHPNVDKQGNLCLSVIQMDNWKITTSIEAAFKIKLDLHPEYPFKPPRIQFLTPIYHPNVDKQGNLCLSVIQMDNWKITTSIEAVLSSLMTLIEKPEPERALRMNLAEMYIQQHDNFLKTAALKAKKHGIKNLSSSGSSKTS
uniref:UBC core domain-containing protein n=1 Tax=Panagrolaimus sp. JU765 TaxID=591449 RepID=A0AC34RQK4_9BILA